MKNVFFISLQQLLSARPLARPSPRRVKLNESLSWGSEMLVQAGIESARNDAEILAAHAIGITINELRKRLVFNEIMPDEVTKTYQSLIEQRANHIPLQHLTGKAPFRYSELKVGKGVFIPRPETEIVAGAGIGWLQKQIRHRALTKNVTEPIAVDLCTGSGAIAVAIATECPEAKVFAVELSEIASSWAALNIAELAPTVTLIQADAATAFLELNGQADLVISNPPYLAEDEAPIDPEVHAHDPKLALYGNGRNGLDIPSRIAQTAARLLKPSGLFVMEHGDTQAQAAVAMVESVITPATGQFAFTNIASHQDLTNRDRFVTAVRAQ